MQLSRFVNENVERKQTTDAFLNEKFIEISLCSKKQRRTIFNPTDDKRAEHGFQKSSQIKKMLGIRRIGQLEKCLTFSTNSQLNL